MSDSRVAPQPTRYDEAADLNLAEVGETLTDPGTTALLALVSPLDGLRLPTSAPAATRVCCCHTGHGGL